MQVKLTNDGEIQFLDGDHLNRNSLNRKTLVVNPETALATRESLWVQFGDSQNFENVNANILEPIRLSEEEDGYKTIFPDEVVKNAGTWYMTLAVRMYSTDGTTFSEQLTSDKVSFAVNDSYPMDDDGYISNGTLENAWQQIKGAVTGCRRFSKQCRAGGDSSADSAASSGSGASCGRSRARSGRDSGGQRQGIGNGGAGVCGRGVGQCGRRGNFGASVGELCRTGGRFGNGCGAIGKRGGKQRNAGGAERKFCSRERAVRAGFGRPSAGDRGRNRFRV